MLAGAPYFLGPYLITPHPKAPHFEDPIVAAKIFQQILTEAASKNFNPNQEAHGLIRELGFVSLYFLLNSILAPFGPYQALDDSLSLNMCNFRQSERCERPGAMAFMFMPRGFSKSRVNTTGGGTFDLLRDPDEQMIIVNAISDKAEEFVATVQKNFTTNDLMKEFYPEYIPGKKGKVTTGELILPNRTRHLAAPTLKCFGLTGAAEGGHYTTILLDDLVGLDSVDSGYQSNAMMLTAKKWWGTNLSALRLTLASRELGAATRYAMDDCYEDVYKSCASVEGWTKGDLQPTKDGLWDVYYRLVEEDGFYLRPDVMDKKHLDDLVRTNPIAAMLNYYNSPTKAGLAEFVDAHPGEAQLFFDQDTQELLLRKGIDNFSDEIDEGDIRLRDCDLVLTTDLAATEKGASAKTCRSSIAVWAQDWDGNKYRVWSRVGFFNIYKSIDHIFDGYDFFKGMVRKVFIESNAFQKIVKPVIEREMEIRNKYLPLEAVLAQGDKKARIRVALGPNLAREKIWLVRGEDKEFREELRIFPMSDTKVDVLDESEKAIVYLQRPENEGEKIARREAFEDREAAEGGLGAMGY